MNKRPDRAALTLRVPTELHERLAVHAARLGISINALIATLLDTALRTAEKNTQ